MNSGNSKTSFGYSTLFGSPRCIKETAGMIITRESFHHVACKFDRLYKKILRADMKINGEAVELVRMSLKDCSQGT